MFFKLILTTLQFLICTPMGNLAVIPANVGIHPVKPVQLNRDRSELELRPE